MRRWPLLAALAFGAVFFLWIAGPGVVSPTSVDWTMKSDWRIHFLGWHIFRGEPWAWPPGRLVGYYHAPTGTSIGYTDSLPLVAFVLKPLSGALPMPFQYLGLWLLACFALQGYFGARLAQLWTTSPAAQFFTGAVFVLTPTLLNRAPHPALCAHWTLLWALLLSFRYRPGDALPYRSMLALGLVIGLVHPYLAVMVLAVLTAFVARALLARNRDGRLQSRMEPVLALLMTAGITAAGWWASGMFLVSGESMARTGLGYFSMNLLAPVTPSGWSSWMPDIAVGAGGQTFEGLQYFGAGLLLLVVLAAVLALTLRRPAPGLGVGPLLVICLALALYALSPRVTFADRVVLDYSSPVLDRVAIFGVTGRFFWPAAYALLALAARTMLTRLPAPIATALLVIVIGVQILDLRPAYAERYALAHSKAFHEWPGAPRSPVWTAALPHYDHLVLFPPLQCGPAPVLFELPAYLAGLHGLTVNVGEVARSNEGDRARYCDQLERDLAAGRVDDRSMYLVHPANEARLRAAAPALVCGTIDDIRTCVTVSSYQAWRDAAPFN